MWLQQHSISVKEDGESNAPGTFGVLTSKNTAVSFQNFGNTRVFV